MRCCPQYILFLPARFFCPVNFNNYQRLHPCIFVFLFCWIYTRKIKAMTKEWHFQKGNILFFFFLSDSGLYNPRIGQISSLRVRPYQLPPCSFVSRLTGPRSPHVSWPKMTRCPSILASQASSTFLFLLLLLLFLWLKLYLLVNANCAIRNARRRDD